MIILCITAVPFFYRAKVYTAYEYLEKRFDAKTRSLTSFFFLMSRGLGVGVIIAAPSVIFVNRFRLERNYDDFCYRFDDDALHDDRRCAGGYVDGR